MSAFTEADFETRYRQFDSLDPVANGALRKQLIRELERDIGGSEGTWLKAGDAGLRVASASEIDRVHVYLLAEQGRIASSLADLRRYVEGEWDRLARSQLDPTQSRQPLHYGLRAYASKLRSTASEVRPMEDVPFYEAIEARLAKSPTDSGSRVHEKAREVLGLLSSTKPVDAGHTSQISAAKIAAIGTIIVAIIGVAGLWGAEIIKAVFGAKPSP